MKKLNNKGFAFSTMMYGLVIMMFLIILAIMSTLGNTRRNTKSLGETVEEELNRYTATNTEVKSDEIDSPHTIPTSGWYQIELMSKREGSTDGDYLAGVGYFYAGTILYINAGTNKPQIKYKEKDNGYILMSISDGFPYMSGFAGSNFSGQTKPVIEEDYVPIFYNGLFIKHTNDSGDSKVRITKISDNDINNNPIKLLNDDLDNVRYIRDCATTASTGSGWVQWTEIQAIDTSGNNVAKDKTVSPSPTNGTAAGKKEAITDGIISKQDSNSFYSLTTNGIDNEKCVQIDLAGYNNLNEIAVWHYYDGRSQYNHKIYVGSDPNDLRLIRKTIYSKYNESASGSSIIDNTEVETEAGIRYSRYQPSTAGNNNENNIFTSKNIDNGTYYIIAMNDRYQNRALTNINNSLSFSRFTAANNQKWEITKKNTVNYVVAGITRKADVYAIKNISTGYKLEMINTNKHDVVCTNPNDNDNQNFEIQNYQEGYFQIGSFNLMNVPVFSGLGTDLKVSYNGSSSGSNRLRLFRVY